MADTPTLLYEWLRSHFPGELSGLGGGASGDDFYLVKQGVLVGSPVPGTANVWGRWNHSYQVRTLDGGDSFKLQGTLVSNPGTADWVDITGHTAITANGYGTFTGSYRYIRVVKNSGSGTGTSLVFGSVAA